MIDRFNPDRNSSVFLVRDHRSEPVAAWPNFPGGIAKCRGNDGYILVIVEGFPKYAQIGGMGLDAYHSSGTLLARHQRKESFGRAAIQNNITLLDPGP